MTKATFGIIGYGRFGKLWGHALSPFGDVLVYEKNGCTEIEAPLRSCSLDEVTQCDMVFILAPISEFESLCQQIKDKLNPHSLLVDCCSVKIHPVKIMKECFPSTQPIIGTHPLFGPDSVNKTGTLGGHKIVLCPIQNFTEKLPELENILQKLHLHICTSTPEEHDKQMASSQSLVHFIGRGLAALDLKPQELSTPDFQALLNINQMVVHDTWQLFLDMHKYNPYAKQVRKKFVDQLLKLEEII
ncbi:MAG: prephenate dehydrogenase/arogenate dehydrogenase family protein [Gammaproteobacteria bacterium]|jgi:prephenate dehydrogenase|nr:prephenate dehydrogenase/arogenate dehydrogenase family protein [Gammaproteobacteria bacterium]